MCIRDRYVCVLMPATHVCTTLTPYKEAITDNFTAPSTNVKRLWSRVITLLELAQSKLLPFHTVDDQYGTTSNYRAKQMSITKY